ncbi:MAG: hypothetical protein IPM29_14205 [Planctomycetes bacterium]|nr:hypothetical protein [Planctomycetota bacterium]
MTEVTRRIGLSLGADLCWPLVFEDLVRTLDLRIPVRVTDADGREREETVRFEVERITIEPFDLQQPVRYDLVVDRLTHWYHTSREWIKKAVILDGTYVFNNPWSVQSMEKQTTYCAMMRLGMPIPRTVLIPPKEYQETADLRRTLESYARMFDLGQIGRNMGYPLFMKPYDGGGWVGVSKVDNEAELRDAYEESGRFVMHLQKGVHPYEEFVRCIGLGPQVRLVRYDPTAPLHARYQPADRPFDREHARTLRAIALTINAFFGWDFNSAECLLKDGVWHPIDFANPCPDSQVTSLHEHFPWLVKAKLRWALFCAATRRRFRQNLNWQPFWDVAARPDLDYAHKLELYAAIAERHFDLERFDAFCAEHLGQLDRVAWEYFGTADARRAIRAKVEALFPRHEWDDFTEHFWQSIQRWRKLEEPAT